MTVCVCGDAVSVLLTFTLRRDFSAGALRAQVANPLVGNPLVGKR